MTVMHTMNVHAPDEHLLVIDFDFFFPTPQEGADMPQYSPLMFDWGHREAPIFLSNMVWATRGATFHRAGLPLPGMVPPEGGWGAFWERFTIRPGSPMLFADSNMHAGALRAEDGRAFASVDLFDAHHDSGYNLDSVDQWLDRGTYSCEDWMLCHQLVGTPDLRVHYPPWKGDGPDVEAPHLPEGSVTTLTVDDGAPLDKEYTAVFVCRSGAWVPAWCDSDFTDFLAASTFEFEQVDEEVMDREFDMDDVVRDAEAIDAAFKQLREHLPQASTP